MAKTPPAQPGLFAASPFAFADRFLQDHAGQIISEPRTAILELIANSYDAGAMKIDINWPTEKGQKFSVTDDGIGMTRAEFERRWRTLCYDREAEQGNKVVFPKGVKGIKRTAFGRSGKGRHAPFCFADSYEIATMKDGDFIQVRVGLTKSGTTPFEITLISETKKRGQGTEISAILERHLLGVDELRQLIGSKFIVDPSLCISVNQQQVELMSLEGLKTTEIDITGHWAVTVHFIDSIEHYRSAKLRGISWWVNHRTLEEGLESADYGENTHIIPMVYQTVLRKAHQRTFNLQKRLQETQPAMASDPEVDAVLRVDDQKKLFDDVVPQPHIPSANGSERPVEATVQTEGNP